MSNDQALTDTFRAIEQTYAGLHGNADEAVARIRARLREVADAPDVQEFQCAPKTDWDVVVLHALLKRYGIPAYRYRKQRRTTVLVRVSKRFMNELLWPIFTEVSAALHVRFSAIATSLLPAIAPGPYSLTVLEHDHGAGALCENCRRRLLEAAEAPPPR